MTKRDYELIAVAVRDAAIELRYRDEGGSPAKTDKDRASVIGKAFAMHLHSTNPHFDSERFVRACMGVDEAPHARVRRQKTLRDNKARVQRILGGG